MRLTRLQAVNRVLLAVHDIERREKLLHSRLAFAIAEAERRKLHLGLQRQRACQRTFEQSVPAIVVIGQCNSEQSWRRGDQD